MELCRSKKLIAGIDFHSPWLYGGENDQLYVVKGPEPFAAQQDRFAQLYQEIMERNAAPDHIRYDARHSVPFGGGWNVEHPGASDFFRRQGAPLSFTLETPYFGFYDAQQGDMVYTPGQSPPGWPLFCPGSGGLSGAAGLRRLYGGAEVIDGRRRTLFRSVF